MAEVYEKDKVVYDGAQSPPSAPSEELAEEGAAQGQLKRSLKGRHMQMIAIGGSIGAGLFVGSGSALYKGGPASLVIDFIIIGFMLLFTVNSLGELAVMYPVNGSFYDYSVRFIDPAWGFSMGWNYAMSWLVVLPFELTVASLTIKFWDPEGKYSVAIWITIYLVFVIIINCFGVKGYGEVEFVLGTMKVLAIIGFILFAIVLNCGGVKTDTLNRGYIGAQYWYAPEQAFKNGFHGFCSVFVTASFAFGGTELVGLAAAEADNPRKTLPKATKQVFWRITLFYVLSLFMVGLCVPSSEILLTGIGGTKTSASPFVIAIQTAGVVGLPSVFNAVITLSVISVANSCTYGSTRTIQALCARGMGPSIFAKVDKAGRPWAALIVALALGALAYVNLAPQGDQIFNWLLALSGLSNFFTWGSICYAHINFRKAWALQGRSTDEIPFVSQFGVIGSWIGLALNFLCLVAQFYIALYPVDDIPLDVAGFFSNYLAVPVVLLFFIGYKIYERKFSWGVPLATMDLDAGRRAIDGTKEEIMEERAAYHALPLWRKILTAFV